MTGILPSILAAVSASLITSIITSIFLLIYTHIKKKKESNQVEDRSEKDALQSMLMERLEDKHDIYVSRGYATFREKKIYEKMYTSYHNLGKNGVMTAAYNEVLSLPTAPELEERQIES